MKTSPDVTKLWQLKILFAVVLNYKRWENLISSEIVLSFKQDLMSLFDKWENELSDNVTSYLRGEIFNSHNHKLACYITFHDLPYNLNFDNNCNVLQLLCNLRNEFSSISVNKIFKHLRGKI